MEKKINKGKKKINKVILTKKKEIGSGKKESKIEKQVKRKKMKRLKG